MRIALDAITSPDGHAQEFQVPTRECSWCGWLHAMALVVTCLSFVAWCATAGATEKRGGAVASSSPAASLPGSVDAAQAVRVNVPAVVFRRIDGQSVELVSLLATPQPVLLNFVRSSCGGSCGGSAQAFADVQALLGPQAHQLRMISISLESTSETPERLRAYAQGLKAGEHWEFLTGSEAASMAAQRAFGAARHAQDDPAACAYFRASPADRWVRLNGPVSARDMASLVRRLAVPG